MKKSINLDKKRKLWLAETILTMQENEVALSNVIIDLLIWLVSQKTPPSGYRTIAKESNVSYRFVANTMKSLVELNCIEIIDSKYYPVLQWLLHRLLSL